MHSAECNDNAHVKMHCNAGTNIECNTCRIRIIVHNASIVRTRSKCKISRMLKNVIENSEMIYNALIMFGAQITRLWGTNHTPPCPAVISTAGVPSVTACDPHPRRGAPYPREVWVDRPVWCMPGPHGITHRRYFEIP